MKPQCVAYIMYFSPKSGFKCLSKLYQKDKIWLENKNSAMNHLKTKYAFETLLSVILRSRKNDYVSRTKYNNFSLKILWNLVQQDLAYSVHDEIGKINNKNINGNYTNNWGKITLGKNILSKVFLYIYLGKYIWKYFYRYHHLEKHNSIPLIHRPWVNLTGLEWSNPAFLTFIAHIKLNTFLKAINHH